MKKLITLIFICCTATSFAQTDSTPTLKKTLLEQFRRTHNVQDWFVPANNAIAGLSATQANWKDSSENHSIAQLTTHLIFWNTQLLNKFNGMTTKNFDGDNKETFTTVNEASWNATVKRLDSLFNAWEMAIQNADDAKVNKWSPYISNMNIHNAYHTGQILYIRKMKGWWDDAKGVK